MAPAVSSNSAWMLVFGSTTNSNRFRPKSRIYQGRACGSTSARELTVERRLVSNIEISSQMESCGTPGDFETFIRSESNFRRLPGARSVTKGIRKYMDINYGRYNRADIPIDGFDPRATSSLACHPTERALQRYASNECGPQRRKKVAKHLEECSDCRASVIRLHDVARRFRDFEGAAIASFRATIKTIPA